MYLQRADVLRCLALAEISPAPQNVLLHGPPGTAKTALVMAWGRAVGHRTLARTLSAWTDDAALLGPVDVAALSSGVLRRATGGAPTLTDCSYTFLDELPRAGRGVKDLALSALADRLTPDGVPVPSHVIVAAANTRLVDDDDRALVDRFSLRVDVPRVTGADLRAVIGRAVPVDGKAPVAVHLDPLPPGTIPALRARAALVDVPGAVLDAIHKCAAALRQPAPSGAQHPDVSERRWIQATRLLQASAVLADRDVVTYDDVLSTLPFVLDDGEESRAANRNAITSSIPAYVGALADLRTACAAAVSLARRIEVDREPVSAASTQQHAQRAASLEALASAMSDHGDEARTQADALVLAALDACDDAVTEGVAARRRR